MHVKEKPRLFRAEMLPAGPAWDELQQFIAQYDTGQPHDIRDRTILLLFAVYGLRSDNSSYVVHHIR